MIAQLKKIGIEPGKSFDLDKVDPVIRSAPAEAQKLMAWKAPTSDALTGKWNPPPVTRVQALPGLAAQ